MSLILSASPENNNVTNSTPIFQNWAPVSGINYFWSNNFATTLIPGTINFKIKDVINSPLSPTTDEILAYRLIAYQNYGPGNPIPWIDPASVSAPGYPVDINAPLTFSENGQSYDFTPVFQNLTLLPAGTYTFIHYFQIQGLDSLGNWLFISLYKHKITLIVAETLLQYSPSSISFQHTQDETLPSTTVFVTGSNWVLQAPPNIALSTVASGIVISTVTPETGEPYQIATGFGTAPITVAMTDYYDGDYDEATLVTQLQLFAGSALAGIIPINIQIEPNLTFFASPQTLNFSAITGLEEPTALYVVFFCSSPPVTITSSPWLTAVLDTIEINGILTEVIRVVPIATDNMEIGQYVGFVTLQATVDGELRTINIDVNYDLQGFIQSSYPAGQKAFTLDPVFINFYSVFLNTYFQLRANIKTFDFFSNNFKENIILEKLPVFNGRAKLNYGLTVHKLMDRFSDINEITHQYQPAEFDLYVEEIKIEDSTVLRSVLLPTINFVAGLSRVMIGDKAILDFNPLPVRMTKNGFYIFNVLVPDFNYELRIFKNNSIVNTITLPFPNGKILSQKVLFSDYNQGDIIKVTLNKEADFEETLVPEKVFHIIPEGTYSNHITWENEYLLQSALECHGNVTVKPDLESKSNLVYTDMVEILEYLETKKAAKLSINTGFIIRTQIDDIESLLRSRKVWLQFGGKKISLRPIVKTFVAEDLERELIDYTLEFQINPSYDQETYSR